MGHIVVELDPRHPIKPEIVDAVAFEFQLQRQVYVNGLDIPADIFIGLRLVVGQLLFGKGDRGDQAQVHKIAQAQVTHNTQVETRAYARLYAHESIRFGKSPGIFDAVLGKVGTEAQPEIISFGIMIFHVHDP